MPTKSKPWFTIVSRCLCGCGTNEVHWQRATNAADAIIRVEAKVAHPEDESATMAREIEAIAVFHGRRSACLPVT